MEKELKTKDHPLARLRMVPFILMMIYLALTRVIEIDETIQYVLLGVIFIMSTALMWFLYKKGLISKQRIRMLGIFLILTVLLMLAFLFYMS